MRCLAWLAAALALCSAGASAAPWNDFQIIEWQARSEAQLATLKRLGVTAGTVIANRDGTGKPVEQQYAPLLANGLHWYIENIATDFYSAYHRWLPPHPVNWRFTEVQQHYRDNPDDMRALWRDPSLVDRAWQRKIDDRLMATVREERRFAPLYYSLGDETGIADLSAFWDFDFSPGSLAAMRVWLRQSYGSLAALNDEWGTRFVSWQDVAPQTTREAMRRTDENFAAWADFKAWMDVSFARALRRGTNAVHAADASALAAIEGVQVPGWGGYDYALLVDAVDAMELDDLPLAHSLNPNLVTLTTSFGSGPDDLHAVWRAVLDGSRGLILWDSKGTIVSPDASLGERGRAYADIFRELRGAVGKLLLDSKPHNDPIAILYSPASFRIQWMLDQKPKGDAWIQRGAEDEIGADAVRNAMHEYARSMQHAGLQPQFVTEAMLRRGELRRRNIRMLVLPHVIALSADAAQTVEKFAAHGGVVIGDVPAGEFDTHGRRRHGAAIAHPVEVRADDTAALAAQAARAGVVPPVSVAAPDADVTMHLYTHGAQTIVAVQRDYAAAADETITITLPHPMMVRDLRAGEGKNLGRTDRVTLTLDAVAPALLSLTE